MNENLVNILSKEKLFPIIRSNDAEVVKNTAFALIEGGVKFLEINVESPEIYFAIDEISKHASVCVPAELLLPCRLMPLFRLVRNFYPHRFFK